MEFIHSLKRLAARLFQKPPVTPDILGRVFQDTGRPLIDDGVDYGQPVILPAWAAAQMTAHQQTTYLREAGSFRFQFDRPYEDSTPIEPVTEDPLYEWSSATRQRVLTNTHAAYQRNPLAKAIVDYSNGFVIGDGFNLTCKNKDVEAILKAFMEDPDNDVRVYEKRCLRDLQQDGEIMLRFYQAGERVVYAPMRPWECVEIETEKGFFRRRLAYVFQYQGDRESVPAKEILHIAINAGGYDLRGRPDLYCILPWLRAYNDYLENRARLNHYLNAFVYHVKAKGNPTAIATLSGQFKQPPKPGSVAVTSDAVEITAVNGQVRAGDASEDGRQLKLMSVAGTRMAEYMLGDGQNANLASATAQQLPALTKFKDYQQVLIEQLWTPMFKRVLQAAMDTGVLPEEVEEQNSLGEPVYEDTEPDTDDLPTPEPMPSTDDRTTTGQVPDTSPDAQPTPDALPDEMPMPAPKVVRMIKTLESFEVAYEPISADSPSNIAQALQTYLMNDVIDIQTARDEAGFDHAQIERRMSAQKQKSVSEMRQGLKPIPPGMLGKPTIIPDEGQPS